MIAVALAALLSAWIVPKFRPPRNPVSGVVTVGGEPLEAGEIVLSPRDPSVPRVSARIVQGRYLMPHVGVGAGPNAGRYDVTIKGKAVPARYRNQGTTGLMVQIQGGENVVDFELAD